MYNQQSIKTITTCRFNSFNSIKSKVQHLDFIIRNFGESGFMSHHYIHDIPGIEPAVV